MSYTPEDLLEALLASRPKGSKTLVIYNGPGAPAWTAAGKMQRNGQRPIGLKKLAVPNATLQDADQLRLVRKAPV
jgi:hypothetical protein